MNKNLIVVTLSCAAILAGCNGGGGGGAAPPPSGVTGVQVSGAASKGIVVNGAVTAEELDSSGNVIRGVGNAVTGSDGSYQLALDNTYTGGVIQVTITATQDTQMKCDVPAGCGTRTDGLTDSNNTIDFGEFYKPASLSMTALLPSAEANATINASVTPFTHMAAELAKQSATLDTSAVAKANSEVSNLLDGIDILNTRPVDITDSNAVNNALSSTQVVYAALLTSVASEAQKDANGQPLLNDALALLASSFSTGTILADDSIGNDSSQISLQEIVSAANDVLSTIGKADITGVLTGLQNDINTAVNNIIDPQPSVTTADSNLDKVKAMVSDMRTWGNVILADTQATGSAFQTEVELASQALEIMNDSPFDAFNQGLDAAIAFDDSSSDITTFNSNFSSGSISSPSAGVVAIANGVVGDYTVNMTVTLPDDGSSGTQFDLGLSSVTVSGASSTFSVTSGVAHVTFILPYTIDYAALKSGFAAPAPKVSDVTLDIDASFTQNKDSSGADLPSPVSFNGTIQADLDPVDITNNPSDYLVLPKTFTLTGQLSDTHNSMDATLAINVTNTDTFNFVGDYAPAGTAYSTLHDGNKLVNWSYTDTDATLGDDTFTLSYPGFEVSVHWDASSNSASMTVTYESYGGYAYTAYSGPGTINSLADAYSYFDSTYSLHYYLSYVYTWIDNEGFYTADLTSADFSVDGSTDGSLQSPEFVIENASQWIKANAGLTFSVQLDGLPEASVNINADRTTFEGGKGAITIGYGNRQIAITVDGFDITNSTASGSVKITNQDGVVVNLDNVEVSDGTRNMAGTLNYNGIKYGDIERTASSYIKVTYTDGTFEIF
jgi:hypothetical protein